jgi:hypothetical protein
MVNMASLIGSIYDVAWGDRSWPVRIALVASITTTAIFFPPAAMAIAGVIGVVAVVGWAAAPPDYGDKLSELRQEQREQDKAKGRGRGLELDGASQLGGGHGTPEPLAQPVKPAPQAQPTPEPLAQPVKPAPQAQPTPEPLAQPVKPAPQAQSTPAPQAQSTPAPSAQPQQWKDGDEARIIEYTEQIYAYQQQFKMFVEQLPIGASLDMGAYNKAIEGCKAMLEAYTGPSSSAPEGVVNGLREINEVITGMDSSVKGVLANKQQLMDRASEIAASIVTNAEQPAASSSQNPPIQQRQGGFTR